MARIALEPRKYVRDRDSSSECINHSAWSGGIIGISFRFSLTSKYFVCSHRSDSNEYTQYTIFYIKKENHP